MVEAGKDAGYTTLILVGLGITGVLLGVLIYEFFSSNSPQKLYAKALRMIKKHPQVSLYSIMHGPVEMLRNGR